MADIPNQTLHNHAKLVPGFHYVALPMLAVNMLWSLYRAVVSLSVDTVVAGLTAIALVMVAFYARLFALRVQDRVIRLEMMLRMRESLPPELLGRAATLSPRQLVALRFAGDDELPELCRTVLDQDLNDQKAIKRLIRNWRADHLRA